MADPTCLDCGEPEPCECLLVGTGLPGADYRAYLKACFEAFFWREDQD